MQLFAIERTGPGRLWTATAPNADDLAADLQHARTQGADVVVSMLGTLEARLLRLAGEGEAAASAGLAFHRLPTTDFGTPEKTAARTVAEQLHAHLAAGEGVVVHCRGGVGRSSVLAALVLGLEGVPVDEAWQRIGSARGASVPETAAQRRFVDHCLGTN